MIHQGSVNSSINQLETLTNDPQIRAETLYSLGLAYYENGNIKHCIIPSQKH